MVWVTARALLLSQSAAWFDTTLISGCLLRTLLMPVIWKTLAAAVSTPCTIATLPDFPAPPHFCTMISAAFSPKLT